MGNSPLLWGPNNTSNNLQNAELMANGMLIDSNGPKNLITYCNFENNATTGWSLGTIGTLTNNIPTGTPTFGSGASGNLSIAATNGSALSGKYSLSYASSAATTQGNMLATAAITIQPEYQAKVLTWKFAYQASVNPSNGNFSGTSSNSFAVAVYDVTNSVWLGTAGQFNIVQNSGVGICTGTFQTGSSTASLRFVIYNANASAGAITMLFDDFYLGFQPTAIAPAMGDWTAYTPTFGGISSTSSVQFFWKRIGDSIAIIGSLTGTGAASTAKFSLPAGLSHTLTSTNKIGSYGRSQANAEQHALVVLSNATDATNVYFTLQTGSLADLNTTNGNNLFGAENIAVSTTLIPIAGWSSNAVSSADTDTRVITAKATLTSAQSTTGTQDTIIYNVVNFDTSAAYNSSTGIYTVPVSGYYRVTGAYALSTASSSGARELMAVQAGSIAVTTTLSYVTNLNATQAPELTGSAIFKCSAGDTLKVQGKTGYSTSFLGDAQYTYAMFERLSGPAVVQATELVAASYNNNSGQSIATGTVTKVTGWTQEIDTHSAFSSNQYVVPVSGDYLVNLQLLYTSNSTGQRWLFIYKNGALYRASVTGATSTNTGQTLGPIIMPCNAGDTISFYTQQNSGGNLTLQANGGTPNADNYFSIARLK